MPQTIRLHLIAALMVLASSTFVQAAEKVGLRLDWTVYGTHAPFFLAAQSGLYEKEGLEVNISEGQGVTMQMQIVSQGSDPIGFIDFASTIRGVEQGLPLKAVAGVLSNIFVMVSHSTAPISNPQELKGKVVAMAPAESATPLFQALIAAQGMKPDELSVLSPAVGAKNALFLQKRADAIPAVINVQVPQLEAEGAKLNYFKFSDYGVDVMNHGIVVNTSYLASKPEVVKAFLRATKTAFDMARKDPGKAVDALIKAMPQQARNRDLLIKQLVVSFDFMETRNTRGKQFGWMAQEDWQSTADVLAKFGGVNRKQDLSAYYTNDFLPN